MRCHYIYDEIAGRVLIPGCMAVAVSGNIEDCTCTSQFTNHSIMNFERREFKEEVKKLEDLIADQEVTINNLQAEMDKCIQVLEKRDEESIISQLRKENQRLLKVLNGFGYTDLKERKLKIE